MANRVLSCWVTELDLSSYPALSEESTMKLKCLFKTSLFRSQNRLATPLETAKAFSALQDLGHSESDSEVMLEELYQDFLVSVTWTLTSQKLLQPGT